MYCRHCGKFVVETAHFCSQCGQALDQHSLPARPAPRSQSPEAPSRLHHHKQSFKGRIIVPGILLIFVGVLLLSLTLNTADERLDKDVDRLEKAFLAQDMDQVALFVHPETAGKLLPIFEAHEQELERIGHLLNNRKLIYSDDFYAEFEVTDHGQTFVMIFQKYDGQWRLVRF